MYTKLTACGSASRPQILDAGRLPECLDGRNWCGGPSLYVLARVAQRLRWQPQLLAYDLRPEQEWRQGGHVTSFAALAFE